MQSAEEGAWAGLKLQTRWCTQSSCNYCKRLASRERNLTYSLHWDNRKDTQQPSFIKIEDLLKEEDELGQQLKGFPAKNNHLEKCFPVQPQRAQRLQQLQQEEEAKLRPEPPTELSSTVHGGVRRRWRLTPKVRKLPSLASLSLLPDWAQWDQLPAPRPQLLLPHLPCLLWHTTSSKLIPGR